MRFAIMENGKVVDFADVEPEAAEPNWIVASDDVQVGWLYAEGEFSAPVLKRYAIVEDGWVTSTTSAFEASAENWIECANDVQPDWTYIDGVFAAPPILQFAVVVDGTVVNTVLSPRALQPNWIECAEHVAIGHSYDGLVFTPPEPTAAEVQPAQTNRRISQYAFRQRFTWTEKVAIETASESDAELRVLLADQKAAAFVDLDFPATLAGLQLLVAKGLVTDARAAEILSAPVLDDER